MIQDLVNKELEQREELAHLVMVHVKSRCSIGKGFVKRGPLNQFVYEALGFHGQPGNHFGCYMRKLMAEQGFRVSYSRGQRVYYGLVWREICQDQEESKKPNPENK
jgi:hypothetical protein